MNRRGVICDTDHGSFLPDDLPEQVKEAGVPVSAVCRRASEQAPRRMGAIRAIRLDEPAAVAARESTAGRTGS